MEAKTRERHERGRTELLRLLEAVTEKMNTDRRAPGMTSKETIEAYFRSLKSKNGWEAYLAENMAFTSLTSPVRRVAGRAAYLEATKKFYGAIAAVDVKSMMVEGNRVCALTHYQLQPPGGAEFDCHVAEVFEVGDGKIHSLDIYFDTAPFPK